VALVEIRGLAKTYADGTVALRGVDLDIGLGMMGLLGPNGAGKTTFLSMLVMALEPSAGTRAYEGLDAARSGNGAAIRRLIGYLPQDFAPLPDLTGLEYVEHCAELRRTHLSRRDLRRRAMQLLETVGLDRDAHRRAGEYSGGMKRRLGIAQALVHEPRLVVVDEPTAGLDPEERIRFRNLITDLADVSSVLLSTHIVEDIEATCPRLAVIALGQLLFDGEPGELLKQVEGRLWEIPVGSTPPPDVRVITRRVSRDGARACLVAECDRRPPDGLAHEPTLEDAYGAFLVRRGHALEPDEEEAPA
jgi:ABC-type multidrug transport system ATPase subunit